jgi:hypothetical protein
VIDRKTGSNAESKNGTAALVDTVASYLQEFQSSLWRIQGQAITRSFCFAYVSYPSKRLFNNLHSVFIQFAILCAELVDLIERGVACGG